jgi:uncharacterized repeat protein (TIGR01451 family)
VTVRALLVAGSALMALAVAPAEALAAPALPTPSASPVPSPSCVPAPCIDPPAAHLTLTQSADVATATVGGTVTYTITLGNTGSLPATAVTVDNVLGGSAGFLVEDGTASTTDTFVGAPVTTITRVVTGHYRWTYATVNTGDSDVVRFSAVIKAPGASAPAVISLTSTASTPGVPAAAATTTAPLPAPSRGGGVVKGTSTGVPATGSGLYAAQAGVLLLGGLGLVLLGVLARRRTRPSISRAAPPPARSR